MLAMRSAADDVWMTCVHADDMQVWMTCACRRCACADDIHVRMTSMCGGRADDMHMMPGVVLHEIRQLRQEEAKPS